ncbi:MAG: hypothetical protein IKN35_04410, partial [Lachnospiraceae bacterium]|nr:hypothetical protein [Lachnospiraceae bacterium]
MYCFGKKTSKDAFQRIVPVFLAMLLFIGCTISFEFPVNAAESPKASNEAVNAWGAGGQISFDLSGCDGYLTITVVASFDGDVTSASGWGFDSYTVSGKKVTAVVKADGANSWGFNSNVGIQVEGSGITSAKVESVKGSGTYTAPVNSGNNNNSNNDNAGNSGASGEERPDFKSPAVSTYGTAGDDWLTTNGEKIVDM